MKSLILLCILVPLCLAQSSNILFGNLAATLVPQTPPRNPTIALLPMNINDQNQQWLISGGYIQSTNPAYPNHVWDVSTSSTANNTKVILYSKGSGAPKKNQQWTVQPNGVISSALAPNYNAAPNASSNIVMNYVNPPYQTNVQPSDTRTWTCASVGDPHYLPYPDGRTDLYHPGSHIAGTVTLSKTAVPGHDDYLVIQANQSLCYDGIDNGVYCNKKGILRTKDYTIEVEYDTVKINNVVVPITGTHVLGNGVSVTKLGTNNYVINFPNGNVQMASSHLHMDIYITLPRGPRPTGGVCTDFLGPNYPPPNTTKRSVTVTAYEFCYSWRVLNRSDDLFTYPSQAAWQAANPTTFPTSSGNFTTTNQTLLDLALLHCAPLAPASSLATQCAGYLDADAAYQACLDDLIATKGKVVFAASNVDAFAKRCSENAKNSNVIITLPTSASTSVASGPGLARVVQQSSSPVSFTITAKNVNGQTVTTGGDNFVVTISGGTATTQTYLGAGQYQVSYTPSTVGIRFIDVSLNGVSILNSPFTVSVENTETDPARSTASGPGVSATVPIPTGTNVEFTIQTRTSTGAPRTTGGEKDKITVSVGGLATVRPITDNNDGTYTVIYQQNMASTTFLVSVKINNTNIEGSPFPVTVSDSKK